MLQQEKNIRTQVEALMKEKTQRMQQLKSLLEQDQDLSDILCSMPYVISPDSVPSVEQLDNFRQHIVNQNEEKVGAHFITSPMFRILNGMVVFLWSCRFYCRWLWQMGTNCIRQQCFYAIFQSGDIQNLSVSWFNNSNPNKRSFNHSNIINA